MSLYRYDVVVNVSIDTDKMNRGNQAQKQHLRSIERDVIDSQRRIDKELGDSIKNRQEKERIYSEWNSQEIGRRRMLRQNDYQQQLEDTRKFNQDAINLETRKNQQIAAQNQRFHQERFRQQQAAIQAERRLQEQLISGERMIGPRQVQRQASSRVQAYGQVTEGMNSQALADIDRIIKSQGITDADRKIKQLTRTTNESKDSLGMWGQAFKGAFIGAVAGMSFSLVIGGVFALARAIGSLAVESVKLGGDFEVTTNALAVFTGSVSSAKRELSEMEAVAMNTPGLRLVSAQEGYQQLRALGFQANLAKGFIKELGEEKILSGASDEAIDKVIFNFAQIASGGQKVSQELREIVTQMPTLQRAFYDAFGSTDPKKIQAILDRDGVKSFFTTLNQQMAEGEAAAGGLNDATNKMVDQFIILGRTTSEPLLKPLTNDIQDLTKWLKANKDEFADWGNYVANVLRGVSILFRESRGEASGKSMIVRGALASATFGMSEGVIGLTNQIEGYGRNKAFEDNLRGGLQARFAQINKDIDKERKVKEYEADKERTRILQKGEEERLKVLETSYELQSTAIENYYKVVEAGLTSHIDYTAAQTQRTNEIVGRSQLAGLQAQIDATRSYYDDLQKLDIISGEDRAKLNLEGTQKLTQLNAEFAIKNLQIQKQAAEDARRIEDERRRDSIESKELEIRAIENLNDKQVFDLERAIDRQLVDSGRGYDLLRTLTEESFEKITDITNQRYDEQLSDLSLNNDQVVNLRKERDLEIEDLAEQHRRRMLEIEEKQYQDSLKKIETQFNRQKEMIQSYVEQTAFGQSLLSPESFANNSSRSLQRALTGTDLDQLRNQTVSGFESTRWAQKGLRSHAEKQLENARLTNDADAVAKLSKEVEIYTQNIIESEKAIAGWESLIDENVLSVNKLVETIKSGNGTLADIDNLGLEVLKLRQKREVELADAEIKSYTTRINLAIEKGQVVDAETFTYARLNAERAKGNLIAKQEAEINEYLSKTTEGLTNQLEKLKNADPATMKALSKDFKDNNLREQAALYTEIYQLQWDIANLPMIDNLAIERAHLEDIVELRNRETEAIIASNRAELELSKSMEISNNQIRAKVLEHLSSQTTMNEAIANGIITIYDKAADGIDRLLDKSIGKIPILGDMAKAGARNLLSNITRGFLDKFLPSELTDALTSTGNPELDEAKKQTRLLERIAGARGLGAVINNNVQVSGGNTQQSLGTVGSILGAIFGGGGSGGRQVFNSPGELNQIFTRDGQILSGGGNSGGGLLSGIFGKGGIFGKEGFGNNVGTYGTIGAGAGILGSLISSRFGGSAIGRRAGGILSGAGTGMALGAQIGSIVPGIGTAIGAGVGAIVGAIAGFFGAGGLRKKEEQARTQFLGDAFKQMDTLIERVNNDQMDGSAALSAADQIRAQYLEQSNSLKDNKTRRHALQDVSRIDAKIEQLKAAVASQTSRQQRLELFAPTFADGGALSKFANDNYRNNPLGYQRGGQKLGFFPASKQYAIYNEEGPEYIFDAETTRNVGIDKLDLIRQTKGQVLNSMLFRVNDVQQKAVGGALAAITAQAAASTPSANTQATQVHVHLDGSALGEVFAQALSFVVIENNGSSQQINALSKGLENEGQTKLVEQIAQEVIRRIKG